MLLVEVVPAALETRLCPPQARVGNAEDFAGEFRRESDIGVARQPSPASSALTQTGYPTEDLARRSPVTILAPGFVFFASAFALRRSFRLGRVRGAGVWTLKALFHYRVTVLKHS